MSNRRGNSGDRPTPRKPKVPLPVVARSEGRLRREQVDEQSDPSSRPVRGRTSTIARPVSRRQQGDAASLRRFLILSTLGLALAISLSAFIVYVFNRPPNVPLIARLSTSKSNILGEHPAAVLFRQSKNEASSRAESPPNRERSFRYMDFENESSIGTAGGRNRNVVLFYFNGIVTTDPNESDSVQLWFDDNSFSTASRDRTSVDLKSLLLDISTSKKLSSSAHALVILDVAPPAVTTNLGDLVFPAKAIQGIFEKMPDENKKRLSVLLPSSQGEESWIAPELGSSVFGHFASQGIETGFGDPALTIKTYADKVAEQVAGWVKLKRSATQSPWLLTSKEDFSNFKLFTSFFKTPEFTPPIRVEYGTRTEKLAGLWSDFDQLKGYRWLDPVLYGSIESQLLILEDIAETPGNLAQRVEQIKESFVDLKSRWKPTLRPSLIESRFYQELGLDTRTRFSSESIQGTLEGNLDVSRKSRDDQAILLWNTWYKVASEGGAQNWRKEFQPSTMKARLDSLGAAEKVEWLEIQFGRILCDASPFNPSNEDDSHIRATAKLIKAFGDLQTIATTTKAFGTSDPKPTRVPWERTRLMQEDFNNIEARFLELVDHFIVQDYKKALSEHSPLLEHIVSLQAKANQIDEAIEFRDRVLYEAPHLLAFLLREYRYIAVDQPSNEEAKKTGIAKFEQIKSMLKPARDIEKKLREERVVELPQVTVEEWDKLIAAELSDKTLLRGENLDSRTIRVYRASLRTPFIKTTDRKDRYRSMSDFYAKGPLLATASNEEDKPVNQTVQVLEMPLELKDESFRFSKEQIDLSTDSSMRSRIFRLSRLYEKPASSESGDNNRGVLRVELENQEKAFLAWQQYRHYVKRFGAGELPTDPEDYYFRQIAKAYSTPLFVNDKSSSAIQDDDDAWNPAKDAFKKLRDSGGERSEDRTTITIQDSSHWKARSKNGVKVGLATDENKVVKATDLGENDRPKEPISFEESQRTGYKLLLRGHRLTLSLGEQKNLSKFGSEFVNKPKPATIIVQTKPKTQAIAILLDCSASMNSVNDEKIPLEDKKIPLEDAKEVVRNLLFSLIKLHESGLASSEVCLIPFGLNVQEPKQGEPVEKLLEHFEVASIGNTTLYGLPGQISKNEKDETIPQFEQTAVLKSDFFPCNLNNHIPEFTKRLKPIQAQGTTPLYNAMIVGLEELKTRKSSVKKLVVLSDGANYDKNSLFYLDSIQRGLQSNLDISLYFFQFENPSYTKRINGTPYFNVTSAENEKFFAMLKKLPNRADGVGTQATFKDFNDLSHAVEASFALPEITIIPSISGSISFNKPVTMPTGKYKLSVKNRNSSTPASIDLIIRGSETLKIDYDDQLNKLSLSQGKPRGLVLKPEDSSAPLEPWSIWKEKVNDEITFSVRRDENNNRKAAPIQQILQPFICFAKVSDDSNGISYALADYKVEDVYPPTLGFPLELNQAPKSVRFDLWYCDDEERLPGAKFPVPLSKTLELPNGSLRRDANGSITVDIKSSKEDRVFIICREASMVTREMRGLMEPDTTEISEKHVFTVAKEVTETTVYIVKESELNNEKIGHVYHEEFPLN